MSDCPKGFWNPIALKPIASLAALRKVVTEHNEKRMPKWKFRLASDLIVQIQLQLTATFRDFACRAIECPGADEKVFAPRAERRPDQTNLKFDIYSDIPNHWARLNYTGFVPGQWVFKPTRIGWARDGTPNFGLAARLVQVLNDGRFDRIKPAMLLSPPLFELREETDGSRFHGAISRTRVCADIITDCSVGMAGSRPSHNGLDPARIETKLPGETTK